LDFAPKINVETRSPKTVNDLIAHYSKIELSEGGGKRTSTREVYEGYLRVQIAPKWGHLRLDQVKTVAVEGWLRSLYYAPGTLSKIRNIMYALFTHAKLHDMIQTNPIEGVRCSSNAGGRRTYSRQMSSSPCSMNSLSESA
jgi:hypothetical protein